MSFPSSSRRILRSFRLSASPLVPAVPFRAYSNFIATSNALQFPRRIGSRSPLPSSLLLRTAWPSPGSRSKSTATPAENDPSPPPINSNSIAVEKEQASEVDPALEIALAKPKIQLGEVRRLMQLARPEYKVIGLALSLVSTAPLALHAPPDSGLQLVVSSSVSLSIPFTIGRIIVSFLVPISQITAHLSRDAGSLLWNWRSESPDICTRRRRYSRRLLRPRCFSEYGSNNSYAY